MKDKIVLLIYDYIRCKACERVNTFYTSKKVQHSFDVNNRFVYAMRSVEQGHVSM